jgi:glycosyltransferase involved in cell wall biosynthesis
VDTDRFVPLGAEDRRAVKAGIGLGEEELMILFVGRLERGKGPHLLIDSVRRLPMPTHVVLCGSPESSDYVAELRALANGAPVSFLGHRTDVPNLMGAADLLVVPSTLFETQGLVVSEAMACGIPVVASAIGGLAESMRGFPEQLVTPADPAALGIAIESCVDWRRDKPDLGARSRAWSMENMSLSRTIESVDRVLTGTLRDA